MSEILIEKQTAVLQKLQTKQAAVNVMLEGARLVHKGGVEGIQAAAEQQPELLLFVIESLVRVIEEDQESAVWLTNEWFTCLDKIHAFDDLES